MSGKIQISEAVQTKNFDAQWQHNHAQPISVILSQAACISPLELFREHESVG
jgi:hypothetical protein